MPAVGGDDRGRRVADIAAQDPGEAPVPRRPGDDSSAVTIRGRKSRYMLMRRKVWRTPASLIASSVAQWWRASVKVASGAAPTKDR